MTGTIEGLRAQSWLRPVALFFALSTGIPAFAQQPASELDHVSGVDRPGRFLLPIARQDNKQTTTPATNPNPKSTTAAQSTPPTGVQNPNTSKQAEQKSNAAQDFDLDQLTNTPVRPAERSTSTPAVPRASSTATGSTISSNPSIQETPSTTGELLNRAPSVSVRRTSAVNLDPRIRGLHSGQISAAANGMTQVKSRVDIDSLFSQIDPSNVENVDVINGPYTSLYGPGFGFLIAELNQPPRYACPQNHGLFTSSYTDNGSALFLRGRLWGGGEDWGYNIGYSFRNGSDYETGDRNGDKIPASYRKDDIYLAFSKDLGAHWRADIQYLRSNIYDLELPGIAYDIDRQKTDQYNLRIVGQDNKDSPEDFVLQTWRQRTPFHGTSDRDSKQRTFYDVLLGTSLPDQFIGGRTIAAGLSESDGVRMLRTFGDKSNPQFTVGVDWRRNELAYQEIDFDPTGAIGFGGNIFGIPASRQEDFGAFAHLSLPVNDKTTISVGGRVDRVHSSLQRDATTIDAPNDPTGFYRPGFDRPDDVLFMGYLATEFRPKEWLKLNSGVGYASRSPNLTELYADEPYVPIARFGNSFVDGESRLKPEQMLQFDLGATAEWESFQFGAKAFYSNIWDYILPIPTTFSTAVPAGVVAPTNLQRDTTAFGIIPGDPAINSNASTHSLSYRYDNIDRADMFGGELFAEWKVRPGLEVRGDLGYVKATNHNPVFFDDATQQVINFKSAEGLPGIAPLNSTISVRIFEPENNRWSLTLQSRMVRGQEFVADSLGELTTPGFTIFNVHGSYQATEHLRVFASVLNLLDRAYTEHGSLVISNSRGELEFVRELGRSFLIGMEMRF